VSFGAFLSGGIDSSIIVAVMSKILDQPVKTFSVGFEEESYNELPFARLVADKYKTEHHEFVVKPDVVDVLPKLMWSYNEPFADPSAVPTYYLSKATREHVTVALSGDGGDECFAGYNRYVDALSARKYEKFAKYIGARQINKVAQMLPFGGARSSFFSRSKRYLKYICGKSERHYMRWISHLDSEMRNEIYSPSFKENMRGIEPSDYIENLYNCSDAETFIDKILNVDVMSYLPEDLMVKADIASMACSLEVRSPFIDHKIMEFAASLPSDMKIFKGTFKYFLKQVASDLLPAEVIQRKKLGFGLPISPWLRGELKEMAYDILLDKRAVERGYFRKEAIEILLAEHMTGQCDHSYRIWNLLCLELWFRAYTIET
jgi:asparagine synthase (glutamine-hydrolysing)